MQPDDKPFIRRLPLFRNLRTENFDMLVQHARVVRARAGDMVIEQGDPADHLYIVVEGSVELFAKWNGRECTMGVIRPIGTFILAACIKDAPFLMSARTLQPSRMVLLPAPDLRSIFRRDSEFAFAVIEELAGDFRRVVRHAKSLKLRDTRTRIAAYLLEQSRQVGNADRFVLPVEKRHVASYLGMTPENLSRGLRSLEAEGVSAQGTQVIIADRARLVDFVQPDALMDWPDPVSTGSGIGLPAPDPVTDALLPDGKAPSSLRAMPRPRLVD
jgi:CRP/FNR family transcriptional regulator, transcriptional activator FtrB